MKNILKLPLIALLLAACNGPAAQDDFTENLMPLCGKTFAGQVVSTDAVDDDWRSEPIVAGPFDCDVAGIRIPLAAGTDTSRTWVLIPEKRTLTLKHDHRHEDGTPDDVSWYGGTALTDGTALRQEFPVDDFSIELFKEQDLPASVVNTWALEIEPGKMFAYELSRPATEAQIAANENGRFFRIEFDLTNPL